MDPETCKIFENKPVVLRMTDNFVLRGKITSIDTNGLVFVTLQRTSYICFSRIATIMLED